MAYFECEDLAVGEDFGDESSYRDGRDGLGKEGVEGVWSIKEVGKELSDVSVGRAFYESVIFGFRGGCVARGTKAMA